MYQFVVQETKDIDLDRILEEQEADGELVSLVISGDRRYLLLHNNFLKKFHREDGISIHGWYLGQYWGRINTPLFGIRGH